MRNKFKISREDFEKLPRKRTSRWSKLMDKISKNNDPQQIPLDKDERTVEGRRKVAKQIRALASNRGISVRLRTIGDVMFVQSNVEAEG